MRTMRAVLVVVAVVSALMVQGSAQAAMPVTIDCGSTPGAQITGPGTYALTSAVVNCASSIAIEVSSSNVTLDLSHAVVDGTDTALSTGVLVDAGFANVRIMNGTIRDWSQGVQTAEVDRASLTNLVVTSNGTGLVLGTTNTVTSNVVAGNSGEGIVDGAGSNTIANNVVTRNAVAGIDAVGPDRIERNIVAANTAGPGITVTDASNVIFGNTIIGNHTGIEAQNSNVISKNTLIGNTLSAIGVASFNTISGNRVIANGGSGVFGDTFNTISGNTIEGNHSRGVLAKDGTVLTKNLIEGNGNGGVELDPIDHVFNGSVTRNTFAGNFFDGLLVNPAADPSSTISRNKAIGNGAVGIDIPTGSAPRGVRTNIAGRNGNPTQCVFGLCRSLRTRGHTITIDCSQPIGAKITRRGSYTLAKAEENCGSQVMIEVDASHVHLNLGDVIVKGIAGTCQAGVIVKGAKVTVSGGVIESCDTGLDLEGARASLSGVLLTGTAGIGNGIQLSRTGRVSSSVVDGFSVNGVVASHSSISRVIAFDVPHGIGGGQDKLASNIVIGSSVAGINVTQSRLSGDLVVGGGATGLLIGIQSKASRETSIGNTAHGIQSGGSSSLSRSVADGNVNDGILASAGDLVSGNTAKGNSGVGLGSGEMVRLIGNDLEGNGSSGLDVSATDGTINRTAVTANVVDGNGSFGIVLGEPTETATTSVTRNHADGNALQGIATAGTGDPSGAHTNEASGNAGTPQCDANLC